MSGIDVQEAFRRGARGAPLREPDADGLAENQQPFAGGPNEAMLLACSRLAGLADVGAAYETGRALRQIVRLLDRAGAPDRVGREFLDNLAGAVVIERMRGRAQLWDAADTVEMFLELYARVLGSNEDELTALRRVVLDYAVAERPVRAPSAQRRPWYLRGAPDS